MQFTKTLIAAALLVGANAAQASFSEADQIFTIVDVQAGSSYSLDLGVTAASLISNPSLNVTVNDSNFAAFMATVAAGDTVDYRLESIYSSVANNVTLVNTFTTSSASDVSATFTNDPSGGTAMANAFSILGSGEIGSYQTYANGAMSLVYTSNSPAATIYGDHAQGSLGALTNDAAPGTALTLWEVNKNGRGGTTTVVPTDLASVNFTVSGTTGTLTVGSVSAVPLPTSVWLFLSGVMGVLSLKRRKAA